MAKNKFITFGDVRIKLRNIKNYGISTEKFYYERVYKVVYTKAKSKLWRFFGFEDTDIQKTDVYVEISENRFNSIKNREETAGHVIFNKDKENHFYYDDNFFFNIGNVSILNANIANHAYTHNSYKLSDTSEIVICLAYEKSTYDGKPYEKPLFYAKPDDVWCEKKKYLYVTTYQNDNFRFYDNDNLNIKEKINELDSNL